MIEEFAYGDNQFDTNISRYADKYCIIKLGSLTRCPIDDLV